MEWAKKFMSCVSGNPCLIDDWPREVSAASRALTQRHTRGTRGHLYITAPTILSFPNNTTEDHFPPEDC